MSLRYNGALIEEGEYFYGKFKKGKTYLNNKLEFKGEFLFGKKWDGKGFDDTGKIIYELNNGKGTVKEYNCDDILIFEGEYLHSERNGKGREYNDIGQLIFEGEFSSDKEFNGIKKLEFDNKKYEIEIKSGKYWNGKVYDFNNEIFLELKDGNGIFQEYYDDGILAFEGNYLNGEKTVMELFLIMKAIKYLKGYIKMFKKWIRKRIYSW